MKIYKEFGCVYYEYATESGMIYFIIKSLFNNVVNNIKTKYNEN